jgi:hypothetical protein
MDQETEIPSNKRAYRIPEGFIRNPLLKYPRNSACLCGSGKKFKKCHLGELPVAITIEELKQIASDIQNLRETQK